MVYDLDKNDFKVVEYLGRNKTIRKSISINNVRLKKRDKVSFTCESSRCEHKLVKNLDFSYFKKSNFKKICRECKISNSLTTLDFDIELLKKLYYNEKKSTLEIAQIFNTNKKTILVKMRDNDFPRRSLSESARLRMLDPNKNVNNLPGVKEKQSLANLKRYKEHPEIRDERSKSTTAAWKNASKEKRLNWGKNISITSLNRTPEQKLDAIIKNFETRKKNGTNLCNNLEKLFIQKFPQLNLEPQFIIKSGKENYRYDFIIVGTNKLVEIQGGKTHADIRRFNAEDDIKMVIKNWKTKKAKDIWTKDRKKYEYAKKHGYDVLYVWEQELKNKISFDTIFYENKNLTKVPLEHLIPHIYSFYYLFHNVDISEETIQCMIELKYDFNLKNFTKMIPASSECKDNKTVSTHI